MALSEGNSNGNSVLVVDDNDLFRRMWGRVIAPEENGIKVVTADDGETGLAQFEADPDAFRLVLSDCNMGRMDGPEMVQKIHRVRSDIYQILATGRPTDVRTTVADLMRNNVVLAGLEKPFDLVLDMRRSIHQLFSNDPEEQERAKDWFRQVSFVGN